MCWQAPRAIVAARKASFMGDVGDMARFEAEIEAQAGEDRLRIPPSQKRALGSQAKLMPEREPG